MYSLEFSHCGDIDDRCGHSVVTQRREEVCAARENRSTRLSEGVDSLFKCSRPKIQKSHSPCRGGPEALRGQPPICIPHTPICEAPWKFQSRRVAWRQGIIADNEVWYFHPTLLCGHSEVLRRAAKFRPYSLGSGCASGLSAPGR